MKRTSIAVITLCFLSALSACNNTQPPKASTDAINIPSSADSGHASEELKKGVAVITFDKTSHDFGTITQGEKAEYSFKFINTGDGELLIASANGSCGCTVPSFSKEPVLPGKEGYIKVTFDSEKRLDKFEKSVVVSSNANTPETVLTITGVVVPKPETENKLSH